jgi:hypothetical protein
MVVTALDAGGDAVGYLQATSVDLSQAAYAITGTWAVPANTYDIDVTGFPATGGAVQVSRGALIGGYPVHWTDASLITTTTTAASRTIPHPGVGDSVVYRLSTSGGEFCDHRSQSYTRSRAADAAHFVVDLGELMPTMTGLEFGDHELSWTGGGGGVGLSAQIIAALGLGDVIGKSRTWTVIAPGGTTAIHFPADVGFVWPAEQAAADRMVSARVSDIASTHWSSYAEARQHQGEDPQQIAGDFTTRTTSIGKQYAYLGCSQSL